MSEFWSLPHPSRRQPVLADNIVATSQPLAAQAGLKMLAEGGNAIDAALAAAIALTVVEPTSNGIGGDAFALVWDGSRLHGLNASGRSPAALDAERFLAAGAIPLLGWDSVTVPGAVSGWAALSERFGALEFGSLFAPAIAYARDGFAVSPITADAWSRAARALRDQPDFAAFLRGGRPPRAGERFAFPDQARTLGRIARTSGADFYTGETAELIAEHARAHGAALSGEDLADHRCDWVTPLSIEHRGARVHELPPNGQGLAALLALQILGRSDLASAPIADRLHAEIEAMKLALADVHRYVADPSALDVDPLALLDPSYVKRRAALIDPATAQSPGHGAPPGGGTVLIVAADADGRAVSLIQSNFHGFGSGIVVPGTGVSLQNRAIGFSAERGHPNVVAPSKRPFHTIIPAFITRDGAPFAAFGVMGGPMQAQGHVQVSERVLGLGENPQAAIDAPRWRVDRGLEVAMEAGADSDAVAELRRRGHQIAIPSPPGGFGGAQMVMALPGGGWLGASDPRKDGQAVGF
ncbi:MAG TPA: gamma-glutamyltransferase family protein [Egibacteraceae bacterium]|nr:gamma-glutamyltransferase family protein [Egibacteraceae bacterium]